MKKILMWGNVDGSVTVYVAGKKTFRGSAADAFATAGSYNLPFSYGATKGAALPALPTETEEKAPKAKRVRKAKGELLSPASKELFLSLVADAGNWSGTPLLDVDSSGRGNLTDLKRKGLVKTTQDEDNRACFWVSFTDAGKELALQLDPVNGPYCG